ncbi:MAG: acetate kinase, partial [Lachnospiraceae bacterium]|nr:acetate kinase [Lachnospiraceae bacterium]
DLKIIVCHLGNGASVSAVKNGKCVDTSMGLTPLEGLIMGTRSGDLDPAILEFIAKKENLDITGVMNILNKKSGVYGMSGDLSSDFRDLEDAYNSGNKLAIQALEAFCYRTAKYVGAYAAAMNGVDAICFTAGIGENDGLVRSKVCEYLGYLGITIDDEKNKIRGEEVIFSTDDSKVKTLIIPTNEELAIARETVALVK